MFDLTSSKALFAKIASIIETSRRTAYTAINIEMVLMYWNIGEAIKIDILGNEKAEYGKAVLEELGKHLTLQYGRGFSERNLFNMLKFYEVFNNKQILQTLSAKLSWSHFCKLMYIEDDTQRDFYMTMAINERWSVRIMNERINSKKDDAIVELLELDKSGIHVGQYYTELPPKSVWQDKLRKAITNAKQLIEQRNDDD
jgi:hypothetical protein